MNSLVLFVGLLAIAFSNGLISSEDEQLPIHRVNRGAGRKSSADPSYEKPSVEPLYEKPVAEPSYEKPSPKPSPKSPADPSPEPYPEQPTEQSTEANEIVSSTTESIPDFDIDTKGYLYLNGTNGDTILTFFGDDKNYTIHKNASTEDYTLGENNYPVNISYIKDSNAVRINFTIVSENSTYDDHLEDIICNWYKWLQRERPRRDVGDNNLQTDPPESIEQPAVKSSLRDLFKRINTLGNIFSMTNKRPKSFEEYM